MSLHEQVEQLEERLHELECKLADTSIALRIRSQQFVVVDAEGHDVVVLSSGDEGPSLRLSDATGTGHVLVTATQAGGSLAIIAKNGPSVALLTFERLM